MRAHLALAIVLVPLGLLLAACGRPSDAAGVPVVAAGDEVTFLVAADTHFGPEGMYERNLRQVEAMNALPGTSWPTALGGVVSEPAALIVAGDLTDLGQPCRVVGVRAGVRLPARARACCATRSSSGRATTTRASRWCASCPAPSSSGTAVSTTPSASAACTSSASTSTRMPPRFRWLRAELERVGPDQPVLLWFHYPLAGPYSDWWTDEEKHGLPRGGRGLRRRRRLPRPLPPLGALRVEGAAGLQRRLARATRITASPSCGGARVASTWPPGTGSGAPGPGTTPPDEPGRRSSSADRVRRRRPCHGVLPEAW